MSKQEIIEFCAQHCACEEFCGWALDTCDSMCDVWLTASPKWLVWVAARQGVLSDKELRLFACFCVRQIWHLLTDDRSKNAVIVAEKYANGEATDAELADAHQQASMALAATGDVWVVENAALAVASNTRWMVRRASWEVWPLVPTAQEEQAAYLRERFSPFTVEEI